MRPTEAVTRNSSSSVAIFCLSARVLEWMDWSLRDLAWAKAEVFASTVPKVGVVCVWVGGCGVALPEVFQVSWCQGCLIGLQAIQLVSWCPAK